MQLIYIIVSEELYTEQRIIYRAVDHSLHELQALLNGDVRLACSRCRRHRFRLSRRTDGRIRVRVRRDTRPRLDRSRHDA